MNFSNRKAFPRRKGLLGVYHMSKLASECVANILNDWYIAIKQQDAESAEKYFEEIKPLLDEMGDEPINWCIEDL
ncbi:response regulator aspartate phosphatase [Bacillus velezensis]|nr:response regulator aspartate phosphatase [Bacillus velezensis]